MKLFLFRRNKKRRPAVILIKHKPLANHGSTCGGWYVSVNITCKSQNSLKSPYQAARRPSLTLLHLSSTNEQLCSAQIMWLSAEVQTMMDSQMKSQNKPFPGRWLNLVVLIKVNQLTEGCSVKKTYKFVFCLTWPIKLTFTVKKGYEKVTLNKISV